MLTPRIAGRVMLIGLLWLAPGLPAMAQRNENVRKDLQARRSEQPPTIDGYIDDPCWQDAPLAVDFTDALLGTPPEDSTVVLLLYDDRAIYIAYRVYDSQPDKIFARETKNQVRPRGEDRISFSINPFHTHQWDDRSFFIVNPLGAKYAYLASGRAEKAEWLGLWKAAARLTEEGWTVEIELPWRMLEYPDVKDPITMGINFFRFQQRTGTRSWWSNVGVQEFREYDGHWVDVLPPPKEREVMFLPYIYLGGVGEQEQPDLTTRAGMDLRCGITPQLTLVGTLNPDFENLEQAVEGIDFSYGARFVPDRRPFFREGRTVFDLGNYYHSRQIGSMDAGLNLFGKITRRTSLGALGTYHQDGNNNLILRISQSLATTSSLGAAYLGHTDSSGTNSVAFLEGATRYKEFSVGANLAQMISGNETSRQVSSRLAYSGARLGATIIPFSIEPDFVNRLGYHPFTGIRGTEWSAYIRNEWRSGLIRSVRLSTGGERSDRYDGTVFRRTLNISPSLVTHSDYQIWLQWEYGRFEEYHDNVFHLYTRARVSDQFTNYGVSYSWGERAGDPIRFLEPSLSLKTGNLTTGLESQLLWHANEKQQQHILTLNYDLTPALSFGGRLIWRESGRNVYLALRRSGYAGTDIFIILGDPNAEKFQRRLVAKVVLAL